MNKTYSKKQAGFTLFEMIIVLVIMSILVGPLVYQRMNKFEEDQIGLAVAEINDLFQTAQNYAAEETGDWPSEGDNCASAITEMENAGYLDGFSVRTPFGTDIVTSCTTGAGKRFSVTVDATQQGTAELLNGYLPSSTVTNRFVTVSVPMPAAIPALEHLLPRDGSREMTGDLDMGGNSIVNNEDIDIASVGAKASEGIYFAGIVNNGDYVDKPQCPTGSTPTPIVIPTGMSDNGRAREIGAVYAWAQDSGSQWRIRLRISVKRDGNWNEIYPGPDYGKLAVLKKCV